MDIRTHTFTVKAKGFTDVIDITARVAAFVREDHLREGSALVFVAGSTGGVTTIEYESGAISDLRHAIERLAPQDIHYAHDARWGDGNGFAHVRAALLKASLEIPVAHNELMLGTWQQIVLCDFDNRARERRVVCQLRGNFAE